MAFDIKQAVIDEAKKQGVDPDYALSVMGVESGGNPNAISKTGARGAFQMFPAAVKDVGGDYDAMVKDPALQVQYGVKYLKQQLDAANGDKVKALGYYNQGKAGFDSQIKSGNYAPEVVNYINHPNFSKWVGESKIKGIANPVSKLNQNIESNKFTPDQLSRGALKNATTQAEAEANSASMQPTQAVENKTPSNSLLQTQQAFNNALQSQQIEQDAAKREAKQKGYQDLTYMALGAILGRNANKVKNTTQRIEQVNVPQMQYYGNQDLYNFRVANKGG